MLIGRWDFLPFVYSSMCVLMLVGYERPLGFLIRFLFSLFQLLGIFDVPFGAISP